MEHKDLSSLVAALERGTKMHISVAFLSNYGNHMTRCTHSQTIHDSPVCKATKTTQEGLSACYRCRMTVQRAVIERKKSMSGYCTKGVYEYCRPVIYEGNVIAVIFVGNILTDDSCQLDRLLRHVEPELLSTMERQFTPEDCTETADIVESYILFLIERYGSVAGGDFDPLLENIKNFIRENVANNFTVEDLAKIFGYNPKYLGRLFSLREGCSVRQFCNKIKIRKAKELLAETDLCIADIARQVGFDYVTYFDRVFQEYALLTPRAYRLAVKPKVK